MAEALDNQPLSDAQGRAAGNPWRGWVTPLVVLLTGLALTTGGVLILRNQAKREDQRRFELECEEMWKALEGRLQRFELKLRGVQEFCAFHLKTKPEEFTKLWEERIERLNYRNELPGLWELGYAVLEDARSAQLSGKNLDLHLKPDLRLMVQQRERLAVKPAPTGDNFYDLAHAPTIWRAWQDEETRATGRVELGRTFKGMPRLGYRLVLPVFDPAHTKMTPQPRGVVFAAFLLDHTVLHQFGDNPRGIEFEVFAGATASPTNQLTGQVVRQSGAAARSVAADSPDPLRATLVKSVHGTKWSIACRNTVLFTRSASDRLLRWMGIAGIALSLTMCVTVRLQVVRRLEAEAAAQSLAVSENKVRREGEERERLVRDLHDRTIQSLLAVNAQLVRCAGLAEAPGATALRDEMDTAAADLDAAVNEVREGILRIGPATEAEVPFREAMTNWLARLNRGHDASLTFESDAPLADRLDIHTRTELTAIIREAVSNALRHGHAERVVVSLRMENGQGLLTVHDDGSGFDPSATGIGGHGLKHLRQRAKDLGGECLVDSRPGGPTTLRVRFATAIGGDSAAHPKAGPTGK
jgi:signal transduction histidine kinase